ncbi:MAG TPA: hypothetical protein VGQ99_01320 [Tepidisphaeraceae bacterium]|jgi:uncharacterized coiled-coil protein SlyX|nr:hypothetical protein [Tepidisphaeraceae bacterium]
MAAVSQPGSRAGLITALVIFVVLFLVSTVLFFTTNADNKVKEKQLEVLGKKYADVIKTTEMTDPDFEAVKSLQSDPANRGRSMFDIMRSQREDLAKAITGQANTSPAKAVESAATTVQSVNKTLEPAGAAVPAGSLNNAIMVLAAAIIERQHQADQLKQQMATCAEDLKKQTALYQKELDTHRVTVEAARTETKTSVDETTKYRAGKDEQVAGLEKTLADTVEKDRKALEDLNTQLTTRQQDLDKLKKDLEKAYSTMSRFKVAGTAETAIRRPDGAVTQIGNGKSGTVYVNRGLGQQISPGMTFEVYDKNEGIPRLQTNNDESLPAGKASIEITRVSPGSSEARIIKQSAGSQIFVGDLIANLIYDPNVKFRFKIFGSFDIDQNNVATPQEADVVKRLVAQWGGIVTEDLNIDTDFLVMGKQPVVPNIPPEQLKDDPIREFEQKKAEEAARAYEDVKNKALELHIPVLNQNRFLYFIGFFDQAKK